MANRTVSRRSLRSASGPVAVAARRAAVEAFEPRRLFTAITVTSLADSFANDGVVTLREAIQAANTDAAFNEAPAGSGADTIDFAPALFASGARTLTMAGIEMLISGPLTITGPGRDKLTIDAGGLSRVFNVTDGNAGTSSPATLSGMTLARGKATISGGAVYAADPLTMVGCTVRDSEAGGTSVDTEKPWVGGGGVCSYYAPLTLTDCTFTGNTARGLGRGGGVNAGGTLVATDCVVTNNSADDGGGIAVTWAGTSTLTGVTVSNNTAEMSGGGYFKTQFGTNTFADCTFADNVAGFDGGGITAADDLVLQSCRVTGNVAADLGGGIFSRSVRVYDSVVSGNSIRVGGYATGGGAGIWGSRDTYIARSTIANNKYTNAYSSSQGGAGVYSPANGSLVMVDTAVVSNDAGGGAGGGVYASRSASITNCTFSDNRAQAPATSTAQAGFGAGIYFADPGSATVVRTLVHNTIAGNVASNGGGVHSAAGPLVLVGNLVADNAANKMNPDVAGQATGDYNLVEDTGGLFLIGTNNITGVDPMLRPLGDYGGPTQTRPIRPGSPAVDQAVVGTVDGTPLTADQRGVARPVQDAGVADAPGGDGSDIGAVELENLATTHAGTTFTVAEGASVALAPPAADPAPAGGTWQWDLDFVGGAFGVAATGPAPVFSAASIDGPATRTVAARYRAADGSTGAIWTSTVSVTNADPTATLTAGPAVTLGTASTVSFGPASDPSPADVAAGFRYSFDFNNDGDFADPGDVAGSTTPSASFQHAAAGTYTVRGRVADVDGGFTDYTKTLTVNAVPPVSLNSTADAYVADGSAANTNYGSSAQLQVRSSTTTGNRRESYVKFDLAQLPAASQIGSAKVRLYGKLSAAGTVPVAICSVASGTWTESGLKWSTKPAAGTTALSSRSVAGTTAAWYEFDVTGYLKAQKQAGATTVSFALRSTATSAAATALFNSDEAASNRPQVVVAPTAVQPAIVLSSTTRPVEEGLSASVSVTLAAQPTGNVVVKVTKVSGDADLTAKTATLTFTPTNWNKPQSLTIAAAADADTTNGSATFAATAPNLLTRTLTATEVEPPRTVSLRAVADATVRNGTYAAQNFGSATTLSVRNGTAAGARQSAVFKFDLTGIKTIRSAELRLFGKVSGTDSMFLSVYASSNTSWTESGVTWNNQPASTMTYLQGINMQTGAAAWQPNVYIHAYLQEQINAGRKLVTFVVKYEGGNASTATFNSDEATSNRPALKLVVQ